MYSLFFEDKELLFCYALDTKPAFTFPSYARNSNIKKLKLFDISREME